MHHVALLNGRHYLYTDQLDSVGAISKNDGTLVGDLLRYEPFGDARGTQLSSDITDRGFTGHRENRDIGLTYMNARYYVGEIGRFASADTLVPDPMNPQSFNRYAYGYNNPVKYSDPTGHLSEDEIKEYFGFDSRQSMLDAGWLSELVDWLWHADSTWGDVFAYNGQDLNLGMLGMFEARESGSGEYYGGFYGISGDHLGREISYSSINEIDPFAQSALDAEYRYRNRWGALPQAVGADGMPHFFPSTYADVVTKASVATGASIVGGVALVGTCIVAWPCGTAVAGTTILAAGSTSTLTGFGFAVYDALSPDVTVFDTYPVMLIPDQFGLLPQTHHHLSRPSGVYQ